MNHAERIYHLRTELAGARQATYQPDISALERILFGLGRTHPYSLHRNDIHALMKVPMFAAGCCGSEALLNTCEYLYHVCAIAKVIQYSDWRSPDPSLSEAAMHRALLRESVKQDWLPLSRFARGQFSGFRRMTWWTSLDLSRNTFRQSHRVGLPDDWIPTYAVVMRVHVPSASLSRSTIPTVVDAYLSSIFHPIQILSGTSGMTIDLSPSSLSDGVDEYLLDVIDVDDIEILPVLLNRAARIMDSVPLDNRLLDQLVHYYEGLLR